MHISRTLCLALTLTAPLALLEAAAHPAAAQDLTYQLSGVTFDDGATASGYFDFNPTTNAFGPYNIVTSNGTTDGLTGTTYLTGAGPNNYVDGTTHNPPFSYFSLSSSPAGDKVIILVTNGAATSTGTYALFPGVVESGGAIGDSGEFTPPARSINAGSLIVTPAAVPEASTTVSFGLLLALGLGGVVVAVKKKAVASV